MRNRLTAALVFTLAFIFGCNGGEEAMSLPNVNSENPSSAEANLSSSFDSETSSSSVYESLSSAETAVSSSSVLSSSSSEVANCDEADRCGGKCYDKAGQHIIPQLSNAVALANTLRQHNSAKVQVL